MILGHFISRKAAAGPVTKHILSGVGLGDGVKKWPKRAFLTCARVCNCLYNKTDEFPCSTPLSSGTIEKLLNP